MKNGFLFGGRLLMYVSEFEKLRIDWTLHGHVFEAARLVVIVVIDDENDDIESKILRAVDVCGMASKAAGQCRRRRRRRRCQRRRDRFASLAVVLSGKSVFFFFFFFFLHNCFDSILCA
jgi:hypothetical protein